MITIPLAARGIDAVLLDVEGTTTPIAFVHDVLFPFARAHLRDHLHGAPDDLDEILARLKFEHETDEARGAGPPAWRAQAREDALESAEEYARWLMDRDRKSPALKHLQGRIWERGYRAGELRGDLFADAAPAIRRWTREGVAVAIYSSGSVLAQQLLFASTSDGDLTPLLAGFFDTGVGPKTSPDSYARIAQEMKRPPARVLFVSDVTPELAAARSAGLQVALSVRPGNGAQPDADRFEAIRSLDEIGNASAADRS